MMPMCRRPSSVVQPPDCKAVDWALQPCQWHMTFEPRNHYVAGTIEREAYESLVATCTVCDRWAQATAAGKPSCVAMPEQWDTVAGCAVMLDSRGCFTARCLRDP